MLIIKCPAHTQGSLTRGLEDDPKALHLVGSSGGMRGNVGLEEAEEIYF